MKKQTLGLVLVLASGYPSLTQALSLGDIQFNSRLNEPFKARIELLNATQQELDKLQVHVAPPSIFAQAQLQRPQFIDSLKFARSVKHGKHYLIISSPQRVAETEFNLLLEVTSPKGDLLKRYSVALKGGAGANSKVQTVQAPIAEPANSESSGALAETISATPPADNQESQASLDLAQNPEAISSEQGAESSRFEPTSAGEASAALNLAVDTEELSANAAPTPELEAEPVQVIAAVNEPDAAALVPVSIPVERSTRVRPSPAKVAIPLPKLAFKYKYRVRKGETIFSIAERLKVGKLSLDETVLALYARNPKAFVNGDINQLKPGSVLRTPNAVGKRRVVESIPAPTQVVRQAKPIERPAQAPAVKPKTAPAPISTAGTILASAPATIDPPLLQAVHELQQASQLKLSDLQERLSQTQQLLETRAQENNQLKELVQEKNRLLTRREEELAGLQTEVAQQKTQAQALMTVGAAGPEGKADLEASASTTSPEALVTNNTWGDVLASPLVWQSMTASTLFLLLIGFWQRRRNADKLMQLHVQNSILMPEAYADESEEEEGSLLNFLWGEEELEQAREQLQNLRHSMASLREQSQRLQAYLNPIPPLSARPITSLQASFQL
ncbi:FimV family protein [uncultured Thiothrix sp.]|uniref:type IV pilus assembly protein FimV n=1 Tax=uncultured Thiothrix sp. TaxID=223185 RepID=UPI00262C7DB7|nr:FimV/HubP family polar landmark protein [uncultured Thiothrix sp.]